MRLADLGEAALERADRLAARAVSEDVVHPEDQRREDAGTGPTRRLGLTLPWAPICSRILVDLVIGDHDHDRQENAERRSAALGRHRQRDREQRQHQHHHHFDQAEIEIGPRGEFARLGVAAAAIAVATSSWRYSSSVLLAALAELVDRWQVDRQIVAVEGEGARRREVGRFLDQPALVQAEEDRVRIVGGEEPALAGRSPRRRALPSSIATKMPLSCVPLLSLCRSAGSCACRAG